MNINSPVRVHITSFVGYLYECYRQTVVITARMVMVMIGHNLLLMNPLMVSMMDYVYGDVMMLLLMSV